MAESISTKEYINGCISKHKEALGQQMDKYEKGEISPEVFQIYKFLSESILEDLYKLRDEFS